MQQRESPGDSTSDAELLRRFASGSREALGQLAARHERALLGAAMGLLSGSEPDARDAVQRMWVQVIRNAARFREQSAVKTWLYRILINECRAMRRSEKVISSSKIVQPRAAGSEVDANEADDLAHLRARLAQLDAGDREIILLCHHRGLSREVAAEALGVPTGTLKTRLRAAKEELRRRLTTEVAT